MVGLYISVCFAHSEDDTIFVCVLRMYHMHDCTIAYYTASKHYVVPLISVIQVKLILRCMLMYEKFESHRFSC